MAEHLLELGDEGRDRGVSVVGRLRGGAREDLVDGWREVGACGADRWEGIVLRSKRVKSIPFGIN